MAKLLLFLGLLLAVSGAHAARSLTQIFDPFTACGDITNPGTNPDGSTNIINTVGGIGCVHTTHTITFGARFAQAASNSDYTYSVKSYGGTGIDSTVKVDFIPKIKTLKTWSYIIKAGKVKIA